MARIHSSTVWVFLALTVVTLGLVLSSTAPVTTQARWRGYELVAVIVAQGALGYTQYFLGVPRGLVLLHVIGAVAVWIVALRFYLGLFAHPDPVDPETPLDPPGRGSAPGTSPSST